MSITPVEVFPPGDFLKEELEERGWTQTDFAEILNRPVRLVNEILNAKRAITPETAQGIADALGGYAQYWLNLESAWQLYKMRQSSSSQDQMVTRRARLYSTAPIRDMVRRRWIEDSSNIEVLEQRVLAFLGKAGLGDKRVWAHAARKSTSYGEDVTPAQAAWVARARQLAPSVMANKYSEDRLGDLINDLKNLTQSAEEARRVPRFLADAGIRFVVVEAFPATKIDGISFWLDNAAPVIAMSLRFNRVDNFWFVLMHELFHTSKRDGIGTQVTLDIELESEHEKPPQEKAADEFAVEALVNQEELTEFIARNRPLFSTREVQGFAARLQVHPGIVVGQLHKREVVSWAHFRKMLTPVREVVTQTALTDGWGHFAPVVV